MAASASRCFAGSSSLSRARHALGQVCGDEFVADDRRQPEQAELLAMVDWFLPTRRASSSW
jgi:hypothetical protein